jgi:pyruvate dehydrogenase E2 component (dihydrolipoamide acetyltransferase)
LPFQLELPDIGEGVVEAEVQKWLVAPGELVEEDQPLVEVMTDKATVVIPSPRRGRVLRLLRAAGEIAKVHAPLIELDTGEGPARAPDPPRAPEPSATPAPRPAGARKALATPAVRALAREMELRIDEVPGTGPGGRVTKEDLERARGRRNGHAPPAASAAAGEATAPAGDVAQARPRERAEERGPSAEAGEERVPLRGLRKKMAENMARSKRTAAHFTFVEQCDVSELVRARERMGEAAKADGVKLTFLPFVLKATAEALRAHPHLNATMDEERGELVLHRRFDLGVAASTDAGLVVPVVRDVGQRTLLDLAREIERLSLAAREGRLGQADVGRSTFTVTSLGALGGLFATPVLNHPEVGILGIHRIRPTPVVRDGAVVVRDVMNVSVTCDHRVVDGNEAALFARDVIRLLEEPALLFMRLA